MIKLFDIIELVISVTATYREMQRPKRRMKLAASDGLMGIAVLMMLTAVGFGLAAVYWASTSFGVVYACLITSMAAALTAVLVMLLARWVMK